MYKEHFNIVYMVYVERMIRKTGFCDVCCAAPEV